MSYVPSPEALAFRRAQKVGDPAGVGGVSGKTVYGSPDLSDCLAFRRGERSHLLTIWEPIHTKAPSPPKCTPFCCYIKTVIFYHSPLIVAPWGKSWHDGRRVRRDPRGGFVEWDKVETRLTFDDIVQFDGDLFAIGGGTVVWRRGRWWMHRGARREQA